MSVAISPKWLVNINTPELPIGNKDKVACAIDGKIFAPRIISHAVNTNGPVNVGRLKRLVIVPMKAVTTVEKAVAKSITMKLIGAPLKGLIGQRNPRKTPITAKAVKVPLKPYSPIRIDDLSALKAIAVNVAESVPMNAVIPAKYIGYCTGKP